MKRITSEHAQRLYDKLCPPLYKETIEAKLPDTAIRYGQSVLNWQYNPRGLMLIGPSRCGKTRLAWLLIKRLLLKDHVQVTYFDGVGWTLAVSKAFGDPATTEHWMTQVCTCDLLFIDDLFKGRLTEAQETAIIGIMERRPANNLPTFITTNVTGNALLKRMTLGGFEDRALPLFERMKEFLHIINFEGGTTNA